MMSKVRMIFAGMVLLMPATQGMGQAVVITSIQGNGQLSWTNAVNGDALYRVEWAAEAGGPWYRTLDNVGSLDGHDATGFTVGVPMFYRVVMATNQPPQGMVWIDDGPFLMGGSDPYWWSDEMPVHTVRVSGFWLDETEVSFMKWDEFRDWAETNGYTLDHLGSHKYPYHPVYNINWYDCVKWCNARSQKEGLTPCYYTDPGHSAVYKTGNVDVSNEWVNWSANGYRLPTEAEWEKAARGARQGRAFPWGKDTIEHANANYFAITNSYLYDVSPTAGSHPLFNDGSPPYTSPVGYFPANGYGAKDMTGNVREWCWDWHSASWYGTGGATATDTRGPSSGSSRAIRGGGSSSEAPEARCAYRYGQHPTNTWLTGLRCVRSL